MKLRTLQWLAATVLVVGISGVPAHASYTAANIKGNYSVMSNKWTSNGSDEDAFVGILLFDGIGTITGSAFDVKAGSVTILNTSTYTVNADGSGTIVLNTNLGSSATAYFVLNSVANNVAGSLQILGASTGNDTSVGSAVLMSVSGTYGNANVKGTYSFTGVDWIGSGSATGQVGSLSFDGKSKVTVSYTQVSDTVVTTGTGSGTYSIGRNGYGSITLNLSNGGSVTLNVAINNVTAAVAHGAQFINAASTTSDVNAGTAVRQ
jgi:hypothetical protein